MPDSKSWLLHIKALHKKQFGQIVTEQLRLQSILDDNIQKIDFDDDDDDAKVHSPQLLMFHLNECSVLSLQVLPVNSKSHATGGFVRLEPPASPAPVDANKVRAAAGTKRIEVTLVRISEISDAQRTSRC